MCWIYSLYKWVGAVAESMQLVSCCKESQKEVTSE